MGLDVDQHRLHVVFVLVRGVAVHGRTVALLGVVAGRVGEGQRIQPTGTALRLREPCGDLGDGTLVGVVQRGTSW
ncbi:hypothetical protein [Streptomyces sp. NPDC002088]|uniref:hypothetical protein n=1 Tax=Streptomyces sp. NPDC002088 TaxID=3154665 RepID=UPI00333385F6